MFQLTRLLVDALCQYCQQTGPHVSVAAGQQAGFACKLVLKCDTCDYTNEEMSSPRTGFSDKDNVAFEINPRMVLFSHEVGGSYAVLQKFSAVMGLHAMHLKT